MKNCKLLFLFLVIAANFSYGQTAIILENGNRFEIWDNIDSAKAHLETGDTMYIPGGSFIIGTWEIAISNVLILGAGSNGDSSASTAATNLNGHIRVLKGASNCYFEGFGLGGSFDLAFDSVQISGTKIIRCVFNSLYLRNAKANNTLVDGCIISGHLYGEGSSSINFVRNIVWGQIYDFNGSNNNFNYNLFLHNRCDSKGQYGLLQGVYYSNFKYNVFNHNISINTTTLAISSNCIGRSASGNVFVKNAFQVGNDFRYGVGAPGYFYKVSKIPTFNGGSLPGSNNMWWPGNSIMTFDFTIKSGDSSVGPYAGGFKPGSVPSNPHIFKAVVAPQSNGNGKLPIEFKVRAEQ